MPFLLKVSGVVFGKDHMINLTGLPSKVSEIPIPRSTECFLLEVIDFQTASGGRVQARIVDPVFFDKAGEKQNV